MPRSDNHKGDPGIAQQCLWVQASTHPDLPRTARAPQQGPGRAAGRGQAPASRGLHARLLRHTFPPLAKARTLGVALIVGRVCHFVGLVT